MKEKPTLRSIAEELGLSVSSVSLVLNHRENRISPENRRRIFEAAERVGYLPSGKRKSRQKPVILGLIVPERDETAFRLAAAGLEAEAEGGARCTECFVLRLSRTAEAAREGGYDYFATTLTVSPHKNAPLINAIGEKLAEDHGVLWLPSDFKKRDGYRRSIELSHEYGLYRQSWCGCGLPENF